jgi:hypothetical protein
MTSELIRPDLNDLLRDADSFVVRAITLGLRFERLPDRFTDLFLGYLRAGSLEFAQRHRTGIALGRDNLRAGILRSVTCIDLALEEETDGDIDRAVDVLSAGEFAPLRSRGYEIAFGRLEMMKVESRSLTGSAAVDLLPEFKADLLMWGHIVPETWSCPGTEGSEAVAIDPRRDFLSYEETLGKIQFVRSLPKPAVESAITSELAGFDALLIRLLTAVALQIDTLVPGQAAVHRFAKSCFADGVMEPVTKRRISREIHGYTEGEVDSPRARHLILAEVAGKVADMEDASSRSEGLLYLIREDLATETLVAKKAALSDMSHPSTGN